MDKMFMLFYGDNYYPCAGDGDYKGRFETLESALSFAYRYRSDWIYVYDICGDRWVRG